MPSLYDLNHGNQGMEPISMGSHTRSHICENCGEPFKAKRADARFCSGRCQVQAHRKKAKKVDPVSQPPSPGEIDAAMANPRRILAEIAADRLQPAAARVSAAKALLGDAPKAADDDGLDEITRAAIEEMGHKSRRIVN
jgi:hypothetical protein